MNVEVANRLQQLRKAKGLSQEELANILGLSRQAISKWERAETSPDTDNLICLARLYNISIDKLLDTSESMEEIKERITQERIDEIKNGKDNNSINEGESVDESNNNSETVLKRVPKLELTEEQKQLKNANDNKNFLVCFCLFGLGVLAYIIIGKVYKDWSVGWEFVGIGLFGCAVLNGIFSDRQYAILSFFFIVILEMIALKDLLIFSESLELVYIILIYIAFCSLVIYTLVAMIFLITHIIKNRKETEIIYYRERINEINNNHYKEVASLTEKRSKKSLNRDFFCF